MSELRRDFDRGLDVVVLELKGEGGLSEGVRAGASFDAPEAVVVEGEDEGASSTSIMFVRRSVIVWQAMDIQRRVNGRS